MESILIQIHKNNSNNEKCYDGLIKAEIHGFREINFAKNNMLPLKSTHWIADFRGSFPEILVDSACRQ